MQCIVIHSHKKRNLFNVHNTFSPASSHSPPARQMYKMHGRKVLRVTFFILYIFFCSSCADCRQLSCRCIKRNTSYLLERNRAMIYILRKSEQNSIMHCSDRKICFVFNWNMILRALFKNFYVWHFSGALTRYTLAYAGGKSKF